MTAVRGASMKIHRAIEFGVCGRTTTRSNRRKIIKTLEKCTMLNKIEQRKRGQKQWKKMTAEEYRALIDENRNADGEQVLRNKKSSARGRAFESLLMRGCNYYRQKGIAIINKVNEHI